MAERHHNKRKKDRTTTIAAVDRISNLPCPILHQILSLLPHTDVIRTCVLSKTFFSVFTSFPVIDLDFAQFSRSCLTSWLPEKMVEFVDYVNYSVQRLKFETDLQKFRLKADVTKRREGHRIIKLIDFSITNHVKELDIDLVDPRYSLPRTITSANLIKTLNLAGLGLVNLSDLDLNRWWPMLESLSISRCKGLKDFDYSSTKIRAISLESCVGLKSIKIDSSSLESFIYFGTSKACKFDISKCRFIKVMSLGHASIGENWVEDNVPKFLHLENLKLIKLSSRKQLKVSSENLKKLELERSYGSTKIQASNLESLRFSGSCITPSFAKEQISKIGDIKSLELEFNHSSQLTRFELITYKNSSKLCPSAEKMVQIRLQFQRFVTSFFHPKDLMCSEDVLDVMLSIHLASSTDDNDIEFSTLWNWIASFGHVKVLNLVCSAQALERSVQVHSVNERSEFLTPMHELKHVTIKQLTLTSISTELVNIFLSQSPNLETLHFTSTKGIQRSMEFVYGSDIGYKGHLPCCRSRPRKCWRHSLRHVVLKNFDDAERDKLRAYFLENHVMLQSF